jgi:hypothetical protein
MSNAQKPRVVSIDGVPATVIQPRTFEKEIRGTKRVRQGYYSQQRTVIDGKPATIQVLVYHDAEIAE